jgi:hypothetical protein
MGDPTVDGDPFEVIAESFLARFRAGERPGVEEHAALYPELADQIRRLLPALVIVEQDQSIDLDSVRAARSPPWSYRPAWSGGSATTVSSGKSRGAGWEWSNGERGASAPCLLGRQAAQGLA